MTNNINSNEKFCTKCGKKFIPVGREVICPECKAHAAEDAKRAAVLKAKRASWNGESVPVRISGRASTVIREYGAANNMPFAQALDALLQASAFFQSVGKAWEDITPYKSHRRDKRTTETENTSTTETAQDTASKPQDVQDETGKQDAPQAAGKPQDGTQVQVAKQASKAAKKAVKTTSKAVGKGGKA